MIFSLDVTGVPQNKTPTLKIYNLIILKLLVVTEGAKGRLVGHFQYNKEEAAAQGLKKGKFMAKKIVELAKKVGASETLIGIKCDSTNENTGL